MDPKQETSAHRRAKLSLCRNPYAFTPSLRLNQTRQGVHRQHDAAELDAQAACSRTHRLSCALDRQPGGRHKPGPGQAQAYRASTYPVNTYVTLPLQLALDSCCGGATLADTGFQTLCSLLPDIDIDVTHAA